MAQTATNLAGSPGERLEQPVIRLDGVDVVYGSGANAVRAVEGLNLEIQDGKFFAILGPSGCGKSTLLKMVSGLLSATAGTVHVDGRLVQGPQAEVGLVFQAPTLLPWMTVRENVMLPGKILKLDPADTARRADEILELVGLAKFADSYPSQLSGGMAQRAGIARGLVQDARVMLMDEPFGALDAMTRERMNMDLLDIWARSNKTIVFITHSIGEAILMADRVALMCPRPGRVVEVVDIDLPRPRTPEMMSTPEFGKYTRHFRDYFKKLGEL
ncbi:MAG TPA: ABC transporter ATP-binding protein [Pelagibacterium sp.]|uniref:ABC transporter ATP-binding protein n=1 Tax=Pelagibacterium sp. TaxID=1967288 RepID=UPI002C0B0731|nr:ABC transporter ATP-binding protein [Pelagibacterium sp.]HWJ87718.1 ABC transporter ATP-binding protein [Pelagibacterium sp.]